MKKLVYKQKYSKSGKKLLDGTGTSEVGLAPTTNTMQPMQNYEDPSLNQFSNQQQTNNMTSNYTNASIAGTAALGAYYGANQNNLSTGDKANVMRQGIGTTVSTINPLVGGIISGASAIGNKVRGNLEQTNAQGNLVNREGARRGLIAGHFLSPSTLISTISDGNWDIRGDKYLDNIEKTAKANLPNTTIDNRIHGDPMNYAKMASGGSIHIKPENKGKFNATKKATGKTTEELTHSSNPLTKKRAIFAQNASHWNHKGEGGYTNFNNYNDKTWMNNGGVINNMIQLEGDKHSDISQGINYTPDTKVEAGEGVYTKKDGSKYVFSKELGFADKFDKMKNKYSFRKNDKLTNELLDKKLNQLEQDQEIFKATESVKNKYKYGGKMYANGGNLRQEDYYNFGNDYMTPINPNIPVNNTNQDIPTTYAQGSMDNSGVGTYKTPQQITKNNRFNQQDFSPYLGAGLQAIGDIAYYTKGYNKLNTVPEYQPIQQTDYVPEKLNLTQAQANQDLLTRTYQKQAIGLSGGNSATALNNLNELQTENLRSKGNLDAESTTQWKNDKNLAKQFNIQNKNHLSQFNKQMLNQNQESRLQDLSQMQNVDIGHLSNIGQAGYQGLYDNKAYKNQDKDREMINQLYKNYYMKNGKLYNRTTNKLIE